MHDLSARVSQAVAHFWDIRKAQSERQGRRTGVRDAGARAAVTGGAQMGGFVELVRNLICDVGVDESCVSAGRQMELPGWFRAEKSWDLLLVLGRNLIASIEFKSQIGPSFGNNFNNRTEEALGSATDVWAAYREGIFAPSARPWLGYLMLLQEAPGSTRPIRVKEPHFRVFEEFRSTSYVQRYDILLSKLLRERLYDGACLILTDRETGPHGEFREPNEELSFARFAESLVAKVIAAHRMG